MERWREQHSFGNFALHAFACLLKQTISQLQQPDRNGRKCCTPYWKINFSYRNLISSLARLLFLAFHVMFEGGCAQISVCVSVFVLLSALFLVFAPGLHCDWACPSSCPWSVPCAFTSLNLRSLFPWVIATQCCQAPGRHHNSSVWDAE